MEYAIIQTCGKQYKVSPGTVIDIDRLKDQVSEVVFDKVLLHVQDGKATIGMPYVGGFNVAAKVIGAKKGEKIRVSKFKGKSRYRKSIGFRESLTSVEILSFGKASSASEKSKTVKRAVKKV